MNQILDKISKALRLGKNNSNENEAQSAILAAQRLMAKYHISQKDENSFLNECEKQDEEVIEEKAEEEMNNDKWKRRLMITIAKNFRCDVYYHGGKLILVGAKEDILISKRVYLYAKQALLNSFKEFFTEYLDYNYVSYREKNSIRNKLKREYAYGFIDGLTKKFEKQKADSELSLVVVNANVKDYISKINFSGVRRTKGAYITNSYCYAEGKAKGKNLADIDTEMKGAV